MKNGLLIIKLLLLGTLVTACNFNGASGSDGEAADAWIDAPLNGSSHPVAPLEVVLHAADTQGVAAIELSVNGEVLARRPPEDTSATLVTLRVGWDPTSPGEYELSVRAQGQSGAWGSSKTSKVTLFGPEIPTEIGSPLPITPSSAPTIAVSPTGTPTPTCVDKAAFVADITIPDNANLAPGAGFTKTWRLRNEGTCPWNEEYKIVFISGDPMSNPTPVPIAGTVPPGSTVDLSLALVAPTSSGTFRGDYQIRNPQGALFGVGASGQTPFYVQIVVGRPTSPPPPPTAPVADTQAPSVSISHAPSGDWVPTTSAITFTANASDNVGVTRIEIWVTAPGQFPTLVKSCSNTTTCSFTGGPYSAGSLTYFAIARDAAGNEKNSGGKTITIYVVVS